MSIKVSIIIVNYKVLDKLLDCIDSIYNSKPTNKFEILVVGNDGDKSAGEVLKRKYPRVRYIVSSSNLGYGGGNNLGVKKARGKYYLFLNPDTLFKSNVIDYLLESINSKKEIAISSPVFLNKKLVPYEPQATNILSPLSAIFSLSIVSTLFKSNKFIKKYRITNKQIEVDNVIGVFNGACFMIKRDLFELAGGFDEKFFLYFEENDLSIRLKNLGFIIIADSRARIMHELGVGGANHNPNSAKIFSSSRFYFFRKHYGLNKALITEFIMRFSFTDGIISIILLFAGFLRFYKLGPVMEFIGDQGWFYISARNLIVYHQIPLVGITSSHIWLHQGAIWTYILALLLAIFRFNPIAPAYVMAGFDLVTLLLVYFLGKELFNRRVGLIASFFYATSPMIVQGERFPYHTDLIPFFTAILLLLIFKWIKTEKPKYFPLIVFAIAMLYNFEIATFSLTATFLIIFFLGLFNKKKWALSIFNPRTLFMSILALFPMIPMIIYDIHHGFPQTIKFVIWIFYKVALFFGYPPIHTEVSGETWKTFVVYNVDVIRHVVFLESSYISLILLAISYLGLVTIIWKIYKKNEDLLGYGLLFIFLSIPAALFIVEKTNSGAYLYMFYPQIVLLLGIFFASFSRNRYLQALSVFLVLGIGLMNSYIFIGRNYESVSDIQDKIRVSKEIISEANGRQYNIIGRGWGSQYESFTTPYQYLTWYYGHSPSKENQKLRFYVSENAGRIKMEVKD